MGKEAVKKGKVWIANPKQIMMADLLLNPEDRRTKKQKCEEVGISFKTLWKWMQDDRYLAYLNSRIDRYTNGEVAGVWRALIGQAERGNVQAIRLFFEMKEMLPSQKYDF